MREKSCGAVVYRYVNDIIEVLLIRHRDGHWSYPKGHMEMGESEVQTAYREILEETGLSVRIDSRFRKVVTYTTKHGVVKDVVFFAATPISGTEKPQLTEIRDVAWKSADIAMRKIAFLNDKLVLRAAVKFIVANKEQGMQ